MPPQPLRTIQQIEDELNQGLASRRWARIPDLFAVSSPVLPDNPGGLVNYLAGGRGLVLVAFMNLDTAEIKFFIAKYTDIPERGRLF